MAKLPEAVVWDLDGTLIDSAADIGLALNALLAEHGFDGLDEARVRTMIGDGVARLVRRGFAAVGRQLDDAELAPLADRFMQHYSVDPTRHTRLFDNAAEVLAVLSAAGVRQGICTNKPEGISREILKTLGIDQYFARVVGGDTTPDPQPLRHCLDALGTAAAQAVMIGDSAIDAAVARALDMPVGLVLHGYARSDVDAIGADFLIDGLAELPDVLPDYLGAEQASAC